MIDVRDAPTGYDEPPGAVTGWSAPPGYEGDSQGRGARSVKGSHEESTGYLHATADDGTAAHEVGHLLGLEHHEAPSEIVNEDGQSHRVVDRNNIMATKADRRKAGARPNAQQLKKTVEQFCNSGCGKK